ncbi:TonB-dependent receptor [Aliidiomarina minuta]|uniref:TonB-dependent receptor n=2 Tax=Aliidiomarina minuta TaxID=880057 RepID=A0A432WAF4_9GAMM|nr:TonB-dependent receptor [Aliidiomarina minuta]
MKHIAMGLALMLFAGSSMAKNDYEVIVVTSTQEQRSKSEIAESVSVFGQDEIEAVLPGHPSDLLNRAAGVHVNNLGGEGHMTSIRQPLSTAGVYLFLEDGVPTRPTGFFNHNGLYEINLSQAAWVEVTKGPGSALYGSDAIGGVINSMTATPTEETSAQATLEMGGDNWQRALISASSGIGTKNQAGVSYNRTQSDGYQEASEYQRDALTLRLDSQLSDAINAKTIFSMNQVRQSGASGLREDDFNASPRSNYFAGDVGARDVDAFRLSSELTIGIDDQRRLTLIPFYRHNDMTLMPPWMVSFDPNQQRTEFETLGLLTRYRQRFEHSELITGLDIDRSDADYHERRVIVDSDEAGVLSRITDTDRVNYDFNAIQTAVSPYAQYEQVIGDWRLSAGVRHDRFHVDYSDNLPEIVPEQGIFPGIPFPSTHLRPASQSLSFSRTTPKLGAIYSLSSRQEIYASHRHAFRAPTVGQLFRSGASAGTEGLAPVTAVSNELGWRLRQSAYAVELAIYDLQVDNDIVTIIDDEQVTRRNVNAGKTEHQGVELGINAQLSNAFSTSLAFSRTRQRYRNFEYVCGDTTCNFAGNDLPRAPRNMANMSLAWQPAELDSLRLEAEYNYLGSYYTDETNSARYGGHQLVNFRAQYAITPNLELILRLENVFNEAYSAYTSNQVGSSELEYRPGLARRGVLALRWRL